MGTRTRRSSGSDSSGSLGDLSRGV
eukprot:COSAG06_NODE_45102_length_357_cov_1.399225_1_plen_24_part_10